MEAFLSGKGLWLGYWAHPDENPISMIEDDFKVKLGNVDIIIAYYGGDMYDGFATVIYEDNNELYIVEGSHCSCYGLEGQWEPEKINEEFLIHRINHGSTLSYERNSKKEERAKAHLLKYLEEKW